MENKNRVFSLEDDFMNWETDDLLYGFMRSISTANPTGKKTANGKMEYEEYLAKKNFSKNKKLMANICGCSTRTVERRLEKLIEKGLVVEDTVKMTAGKEIKEVECYRFPVDTEYGLYQKVDKEVLEYLIETRNPFSIRIYVYLLNKYLWKKKTNEKYIFTLTELGTVFGYTKSTVDQGNCKKAFKNVLASFNKEGILKYKHIWQEVNNDRDDLKVSSTERCELDFVIERKADLPVF